MKIKPLFKPLKPILNMPSYKPFNKNKGASIKMQQQWNPLNKILPTTSFNFNRHKGASIPLQKQWKQMPVQQKIVNRVLLKDTDRDGVPNKWDCQPLNPKKQDSFLIDYVDKGLKPVAYITEHPNDINGNLKKYAKNKGLHIVEEKGTKYGKQFYVYKDKKMEPVVLKQKKDLEDFSNFYEQHKDEKDVNEKLKKFSKDNKLFHSSFGEMLGYPKKSVDTFMKDPISSHDIAVTHELEGKSTKDWDYLEFVPTGLTYDEIQKYAEERKKATTNKPTFANYDETKYIVTQLKNNPNITRQEAYNKFLDLSNEEKDKLYKDTYGKTREEYQEEAWLVNKPMEEQIKQPSSFQKDTDGDGYVDDIDCQPNNPKEQGKIHKIDLRKSGLNVNKYGFNRDISVVHGTDINTAKKIMESKKLTGGTFVYPGRGGFEDASNWALSRYNKDAVVVLAETDKPNLKRGNFGMQWITLGDRREEREGTDVTEYKELGVNKLKVFKIKKDKEGIPNKLEEIDLQPQPAPLQKQQEWKNMPEEQKEVIKQLIPDTDGDGVPNGYDCEPLNPKKQDWELPKGFDPKTGKEIGAIPGHGKQIVYMPVEELYYMRGRYGQNNKIKMYGKHEYDTEKKLEGYGYERKWENLLDNKRKQLEKKGFDEDKSFDIAYNERDKQKQKDIVNYNLEVQKKTLEKQNKIVYPTKIINDNRYGTGVEIKYRRTPKDYQKKIQNVMQPSNVSEGTYGGRSEDSLKYYNDLKNSLSNPNEFVPMPFLDSWEVRDKKMGEARHRILAARELGIKEIPVIVDEKSLPLLQKYQQGYFPEKHTPNPDKTWSITPSEENYSEVEENLKKESKKQAQQEVDKKYEQEQKDEEEVRRMLLEDKMQREYEELLKTEER